LPAALASARILKGVRGEAGEIVDSILASVEHPQITQIANGPKSQTRLPAN
jgi:hypothetical protein